MRRDAGTTSSGMDTREIPVLIPSPEHCSACTLKLEEAVGALSGVGSVQIDSAASVLKVTIDTSQLSLADLVSEVERLGHEVANAVGHVAYRITGLDCPDCARTVDVSVDHLDGVLSASLNFASGTLLVEYDPSVDPRPDIVALVRRMDYGIESLGDAAGRPVAEFRLGGLDCPDCATKLRDRIGGVSGVSEASLDFATARLRVGYDPAVTSPEALVRAISGAGYAVELVRGADTGAARGPTWWEIRRGDVAATASGVLIAIGWLLGRMGDPWQMASVVAFALAIASGGALVFRRALMSLAARSLDMSVLMSVAVIGAAALGDWLEGATVVFLFAVGGLLESRSLGRTRRSIRDLMDLSPETARVVRDGLEFELSPSEVVPGDRVRVRPGERIPLDGTVVEGSSAVDESPITGESVPVVKSTGTPVCAGTLNTMGLLEVEVTARAGESTLSRIIYLVEDAQARQAPFQRLVDRFTRYYTPAVVGFAAAIAVLPPVLGGLLGQSWGSPQEWIYRALVLLVVGCPCALVISTPVAVVSAITRATRDGVLVKGGAFLEMAPRIAAVAFDKTGTITEGRPDVVEVVPVADLDESGVLGLAARLEAHSTHPLSAAVLRAAGPVVSEIPDDLREIPGRGLLGRIAGQVYGVGSSLLAEEYGFMTPAVAVAVERLEKAGSTALIVGLAGENPAPIGVIGVADRVRPGAAAAVDRLKALGVRHLVMLTGDNERTAEAVAASVGLSEYRARLLPQDKIRVIEELRERYGPVAMIGDGINDAPALARADIGIAMGAAGSDTALETADVALMSDDLGAVPSFLGLGRRTVANIRQNVWVSVGVKAIVLVAAVAGYAPLWLAVFADTGVALLVILNGLRLLRAGRFA